MKKPQPKTIQQPQHTQHERRQQQSSQKQQQHPKAQTAPVLPQDEDDVGTLTGVSVDVVRGANTAMSVATIPSVLQRQADKMLRESARKSDPKTSKTSRKTEGENLAARRNLTGVTIDVPPHTPLKAQKEPSGNLRKGGKDGMHDQPKPSQRASPKAVIKTPATNGAEKQPSSPTTTKLPCSPPKETSSPVRQPDSIGNRTKNAKQEQQREQEKALAAAIGSMMSNTMEGTMETQGGPTDPEIVEMVLNKLRKLQQPSEGETTDKGGEKLAGDMMMDIVMRKLFGNQSDSFKKASNNEKMDPALQLPHLTPTSVGKKSQNTEKTKGEQDSVLPESTPAQGGDTESQNHRLSSASVGGGASASDALSAKIFQKVRAKKKQQQQQQASDETSHGSQEQANGETSHESHEQANDETSHEQPPPEVKGSNSSRSHGRSSSREHWNQLEARLTNLIGSQSDKLSSRSSKKAGHPAVASDPAVAPLSERDRQIMAETVNKLDENLKSILELQQNSPEKRATPTNRQSRRRRDRDKHIETPEPEQKQPSTNNSATEKSPLTKLETSMGQLFATIMAQMSPSQRQIASPGHQGAPPRKEKKRDTFFSKETEKTIRKLDNRNKTKSDDDDDSTLFVVEIRNKVVAESLTNDFDLRPAKDQIEMVAPSVINVVEPSLHSSITHFQQPHLFQPSAFPLSEQQTDKFPVSQDVTEQVQNQFRQRESQHQEQQQFQHNGDKDPTVIDLTDKSTIASGRQNVWSSNHHNNDTGVINLEGVDTESQLQRHQQQQKLQQQQRISQQQVQHYLRNASLTHEASEGTTEVDTGGVGKGTAISNQGSKLGMVVNLATVYEDDQNVEATLSQQAKIGQEEVEIDGHCVAAAAAGAAAAADASIDVAQHADAFRLPDIAPDERTANTESNYPSEFVPTNNAVTGETTGHTHRSRLGLPQEITTSPADSPIMALLQSPIHREDFSVRRKHHASDTAAGPPSMVVLQKDSESEKSVKEPALIAELLTAGPKDSTLSLLSRSGPFTHKQPTVDETLRTLHGTRLPREVAAMKCPPETQDENSLHQDSPVSPNYTGGPKPTLPRGILAMLEEREGIGASLSDEARALLPKEIVMMVDSARAAPAGESGHPWEITTAATNDSNVETTSTGSIFLSPPAGNHAAVPKDIIAMLDDYGRQAKLTSSRNESNLVDSASEAQDLPFSLPREIVATQQPELANAEENRRSSDISSNANPASSPSNDSGQYRLFYLKQRTRLAKSGLPSIGNENPAPINPGSPQRRSPTPESRSRFSIAQQNQTSTKPALEVLNSTPTRFRFSDEELGGNTSDSQSLPQHPPSLPSKVIVNNHACQTKGAAASQALLPSKSLTSPFPMQFRERVGSPSKSSSTALGSALDSMKPAVRSETKDSKRGSATSTNQYGRSPLSPSKLPRQITTNQKSNPPESPSSKPPKQITTGKFTSSQVSPSFKVPEQITTDSYNKTPESPSSKLPKQITVDALQQPTMETIASPTSTTRMKLVASPLLQSRAKKSMARSQGDLPPQCPGSARRPVSSISPRSEKVKMAISRWKKQRTARSILDEYDDDDDEEEEDEAGGAQLDSYGGFSVTE